MSQTTVEREPRDDHASVEPASRIAARLQGAERPDFLCDELLSEIFARTVAATPDAPAFRSPDGGLTYAEVDRRADAMARGLIAQGLKAREIAGLWMQRGFDLLVAQIAIAKTGAAWLPFDADAPADRVAVCLRDSGARLIVVDPDFAASHGADMPCAVTTEVALMAGQGSAAAIDGWAPIDARALGARPEDAAYLIYTSGSTGVPKGIVITGRNICHYLRAANALYGIGPADIVFQGASVAFDLSMEEIWIPYLVGASLFVATREMLGEADALPDVLSAGAVTVPRHRAHAFGFALEGCTLIAAHHIGGRSLPADARGPLVPSGSHHL